MTTLSFRRLDRPDAPTRWIGYQPDGVRVGHVQPSRKNDDRYAYEALIDPQHVPQGSRHPTSRHRHCGYGDTPESAMWMLVRGVNSRTDNWRYVPEEY